MSGFGAWAGTFHASMAIAACALVVGMILGWLAGSRPRGLSRRERRELADRVATRAARQFRLLRDPDEEAVARRAAMARRVHPVFRGTRGGTVMPWRPDSQVRTAATEPGWPGSAPTRSLPSPLEVAHEWEPAHVGAALAVANGDPITTGEIRAITEGMDAFLAGPLFRVPDGDQ